MKEKLVRDGYGSKVPIEGTKLRVVADAQEHNELLKLKHDEELGELTSAIEDKNPEKIAEEAGDVIESIYSRAALHGVDRIAIENMRRNKKKKLGGFNDGIVLVSED